jgi:hypothetical protein
MRTSMTTYRRMRHAGHRRGGCGALAEIVAAIVRAAHTRGDLTSVFVSSFFGCFFPRWPWRWPPW